MGQEQLDAMSIMCDDDKSTITITKNLTLHGRTKHIDIRYHFIRSLIIDGQFSVQYCSTEEQTADILTKALSAWMFTYFRTLMGVCSVESRKCIEVDY